MQFFKKICIFLKEIEGVRVIYIYRGTFFAGGEILTNEIENIQKSANIVEVISSYLPLTQKGKNYFGVCPFHEDTNPSMSVSEDKQIYKCFSCGAAGNVFTFVKEYENVGFLEAVKIVAEKCGLVYHGKVENKSKLNKNQIEYEIMSFTLKYYQNNLNTPEGIKAKEYLKIRQMDKEAIKDFDIGLSFGGEKSLNNILVSKNYNIETLVNLGLINRNGTYLNDVFQNRIMFPIHDLEGRVVGFTGRIYEEVNQAKYINSKESIIFKKGQILFNYHRARNEIKRLKEVIVVEGNMDAIRMYINGIHNVVALMGTSLTKEQVDIIKSLRARVIMMFDNDEAGEIATLNNGDILEKSGIKPLVVRLTGEKDPDEYIIKNGVSAILNNIHNPVSFLDFKLKYYKKNKDLTRTQDLVKYIKEIIDSIKDIDDDLTKTLTIKKMSEEYDVPLDLLQNELAKVTQVKETKKEEVRELKQNKKLSKYDSLAQNIIYYMLNNKEYVEIFRKSLGYLDKEKYRNMVNEIGDFVDKYENISISEFLTYIEDKDYIIDDVMEVVKMVNVEELNVNDFKALIKTAERENLERQIKDLKKKIASELDENKKIEWASKIIELKKGCVG